jgi:hypothetical protein
MFGRAEMFAVALFLLTGSGCSNRQVATVNPPSVSYYGSPQFMPIAGTGTTYAANTRQEIVHSGDTYYMWYGGSWFASENPEGPWRMTTTVPGEAGAIICARVGAYDPQGNYKLCTIPFPVPIDIKVFH